MDVTDLIESDHREVEELFAKFFSTGDASVAVQVCGAIERHAGAEASTIYPRIASEVPNGVQMAGEGEDEHAEAQRLIDEARATSDAARLVDLMRELALVVEEHVDVEETEVLPQARVIFGPDRLHSLGLAFTAAKQSVHSSRRASATSEA
jgi:hemerythrin superfamily protein